MTSETITATFTYDHTQGVFIGHIAGATFSFIAAPDAPIPTKLRNALHALMQKEHTRFKAQARPTRKDTDAEWEETLANIRAYEERNGVTVHKQRGARKPKRAVPITGINLADLPQLKL